MAKGFLDGYKTYDTQNGFGNAKQWRAGFNERMSNEEASKVLENKDKSPYDILGISNTASKTVIKQAFRQLITQWHPDLNQHRIAQAEEMSKQIIAAYSLLTN